MLTLREAAAQPRREHAVFHNLAYALERLGHLRRGARALDEAIVRGGGDDPRVQTSLGVLALRTGDVARRTRRSRRAPAVRQAAPPPAWFHYASLAAGLAGDLERALELLTEGVAAHPHALRCSTTLAAVLERRGDYAEAAQAAERGAGEGGGMPQLHKNLGDCYYRAGRYDEALEPYLRAMKINPALGGDVYLKLGNIRFRRQEREQALRCWERALELDPDNAIVRTNLELARTPTA